MLTPAPPTELDLHGSLEGGEHGWRRALVGAGNGDADGNDRFSVEGNFTHTDGWRDATAYDRSSGTARWDHVDEHSWWKTVVAFSDVDQDTGANSPLVRADYENDPTLNYLPIAFREVGALRVSSTYERDFDQSLVTVAPYYRDDSMDLLASFTLNFDPDAVAHREPLLRRDGEVAARLRFARRALDRAASTPTGARASAARIGC